MIGLATEGTLSLIGDLMCMIGRHAVSTPSGYDHCHRCQRFRHEAAPWFWDEWRGSLDKRPTMFIKRLAQIPVWRRRGRWKSFRIDLHMFVKGDDPGCFHSHPAWSVRWVVKGGYCEEVYDPDRESSSTVIVRAWLPGDIGLIAPRFAHRVNNLICGPSFSIWFRAPITADVELVGKGWPNRAAPERN